MAALDFWSINMHPITGFTTRFETVSKRPKKEVKSISRIKHSEFILSDHIESKDVASELCIGTVMLCKLMTELGHERILSKARKYYTVKAVEELKKSDLLNIKKKSKLDLTWMVTSIELADEYNVKAWERFKVVEASGLKPVMKHSGQVYFDKEKILPFFEAFKNGTLEYKKRKRK